MEEQKLENDFRLALEKVEALAETSFMPLSLEYNQLHATTLAALSKCLVKVQELGLFSPNEEVDDVATNDLKYFNLDYYVAYVLEKTTVDTNATAVRDRVSAIKVAVRKYIDFLILTSDYKISSQRERLVTIPVEALLPQGKYGLFDLGPLYTKLNQIPKGSDSRRAKMESHRLVKQSKDRLNAAIKFLSGEGHEDEDAARQMEIARLQLHVVLAWEGIKGSLMELELFKNMVASEDEEKAGDIFREDAAPYLPSRYIDYSSIRDIMDRYRSMPAEGRSLTKSNSDRKTSPSDDRTKQALLAEWSARQPGSIPDDITLERLGHNIKTKRRDITTQVEVEGTTADHLRIAKSVLGPKGQIQKPFTIVNSRERIARDIFGTGQRLPTMTIEEILQKELAASLPRNLKRPEDRDPLSDDEAEDDSDRESVADAATEKARRWDDFTEANPKGSGNTMNLG